MGGLGQRSKGLGAGAGVRRGGRAQEGEGRKGYGEGWGLRGKPEAGGKLGDQISVGRKGGTSGRSGGRKVKADTRGDQLGPWPAWAPLLPRRVWLFTEHPSFPAEMQPQPSWPFQPRPTRLPGTCQAAAGRTRQEPQMPPTPGPLSQLMLLF